MSEHHGGNGPDVEGMAESGGACLSEVEDLQACCLKFKNTTRVINQFFGSSSKRASLGREPLGGTCWIHNHWNYNEYAKKFRLQGEVASELTRSISKISLNLGGNGCWLLNKRLKFATDALVENFASESTKKCCRGCYLGRVDLDTL